jgi:hypothetical protein
MKRGTGSSRIARDPLEEFLRELKRETSIAVAMLMRTLEAPPEAP